MKKLLLLLCCCMNGSYAAPNCPPPDNSATNTHCNDRAILKLDKQLQRTLKQVQRNKAISASFLQQQRAAWVKERESCNKDLTCLQETYGKQLGLANLYKRYRPAENYVVIKAENRQLCQHMARQFNQSLKKHGPSGDAYQSQLPEFWSVPWSYDVEPVVDGKLSAAESQSARLDIDNDGTEDLLLRWMTDFAETRGDLMYLFTNATPARLTETAKLDAVANNNMIYLADSAYSLQGSLGAMFDARVIEPFHYKKANYLLLRPLFEKSPYQIGYAVIVQYQNGQFIGQQRGEQKNIKDICYFQRNRARLF